MVEGDVGVTRLLANDHHVPVAESSTADILATQTDVKTLSE